MKYDHYNFLLWNSIQLFYFESKNFLKKKKKKRWNGHHCWKLNGINYMHCLDLQIWNPNLKSSDSTVKFLTWDTPKSNINWCFILILAQALDSSCQTFLINTLPFWRPASVLFHNVPFFPNVFHQHHCHKLTQTTRFMSSLQFEVLKYHDMGDILLLLFYILMFIINTLD